MTTGSADATTGTSPSASSVARVADLDELAVGAMKLATVDGHRVVVARTATGYCALDNACPHQGYGLATGSFDGELVTCQWHNWKFDVRSGSCVQGEEDVAVHRVEVVGPDDGSDDAHRRADGTDGTGRPAGIYVEVRQPSVAEVRARLWPSLQRAIESFAVGQIARDTARLLRSGVAAAEIVERSLAENIRRTEWGPEHELAVLADVLALAEADPHGAAVALAHGLTGLSEATHHRPSRPALTIDALGVDPDTEDGRLEFLDAVEAEDHVRAANLVVRLVTAGPADESTARVATAAAWFTDAVSRHHLSYGHGAIYVHKAFELLDRIPALAAVIVEELAFTVINATREDTLPYMHAASRSVDEADVAAMAEAAGDRAPIPLEIERRAALVASIVAATTPQIEVMAEIGRDHGVETVLDVVSLAAAVRMSDHDLLVEIDPGIDFGWLDITHALTYAEAARGLWRRSPGVGAARLALWTVWLVFDAGRHQRRSGSAGLGSGPSASGAWTSSGSESNREDCDVDVADLRVAILSRDVRAAVALATALPSLIVADAIEQAALADAAGSSIVAAHAIKTSVAARREAQVTGDRAPLVAVARFLAAPRMERFVARNALEAVEFVRTGRPPKR